jgi:hypothetical protein
MGRLGGGTLLLLDCNGADIPRVKDVIVVEFCGWHSLLGLVRTSAVSDHIIFTQQVNIDVRPQTCFACPTAPKINLDLLPNKPQLYTR